MRGARCLQLAFALSAASLHCATRSYQGVDAGASDADMLDVSELGLEAPPVAPDGPPDARDVPGVPPDAMDLPDGSLDAQDTSSDIAVDATVDAPTDDSAAPDAAPLDVLPVDVACPGDALRCEGACVDVRFDPAHCGVCARACGPAQSCVLGMCRDEPLDLAAWTTHACAVQATGEVVCWGDNTGNPLGDVGSARSAPVAVEALTSAARIAVGNTYTCVVHPDNTADCAGTVPGMPTWTRVPLPSGVAVTQVAIGDDFACALQSDGWVSCWGSRSVGQTGAGGGAVTSPTPTRIMGMGPPFGQLVAGSQHACALRADGRVACWGYNTDAQASARESTVALPNLVTAAGGGGGDLTEVIALGRGARHTCAILRDRSVVCWGLNTSGELGDGTTVVRRDPVRALWTGTAAEVCGGEGYTCVRSTDGTVHCWGASRDNVLGGTPPAPGMPTRVAGLADVARITCAKNYVCARRRNGSVVCWGNGPLGEGARESRLASDREIPGLPAPERCLGAECALGVAGHAGTGCAVRPSGRLLCWGNNDHGQLADGTATSRTGPTHVLGLSEVVGVSVSTAGAHVCAVGRSGAVWCWGQNTSGQIGDGTVSSTPRMPTLVRGLSDVVQVAAGDAHTCAVQRGGRVYCWGANDLGQIGDDSVTRRPTPTLVGPVGAPLPGVTQISAGGDVTCALRAEGRVTCWGSRAYWQLGDGRTTTDLQRVPVEVREHDGAAAGSSALMGATEVSVSSIHACAVLPDRVVCWGSNPQGQLGISVRTIAASSTPRTVPGDRLGGARAISALAVSSNVVRADGTYHSWTHDPSGNPFHYEHDFFRDALRVAAGGPLDVSWGVVRRANGTLRAWGRGVSTGSAYVHPAAPVPFVASP